MNKNPILIFGTDRSGTSMIGNIVEKWGANGGKSLEKKGDAHNPNGYFENLYLHTIISEHLGDIFQVNYNRVLEEKIASKEVRNSFGKFIREMESESDGNVWFTKEPFIGVMLPFFKSFFDDPVCIIAVRNPYDIAHSWQKFVLPKNTKYSIISATLLRWQYTMTETLKNVQGLRKIFISYEDLHSDPENTTAKIANFLDRSYGISSNQKTLISMSAAVDKNLYRNKSNMNFFDFDGASLAQKDLYKTLIELVEFPDKTVNTNYLLPIGWNEYILTAIGFCDLACEINERNRFNPFGSLVDLIQDAGYWLFCRSSFYRSVIEKIRNI